MAAQAVYAWIQRRNAVSMQMIKLAFAYCRQDSSNSWFSIFVNKKTMEDRKPVVKSVDMSDEMQQEALTVAADAIEQFNIEKDIAAHIKKEFDKKFSPTWHCVVGRNFGSYVTHETKHFIYFYLGSVAILLFKSG
ncbi:hypothetical protein GJ496_011147 [Pomphorhynchus laevis]|nr:hypothetical protein GJ496_011147 [Pomphorhynchus laevis]